ncbi:MacB family efflux pump subunit [Humibacter antri]
MLSLRNVSRRYAHETEWAIRDASLDVYSGDFIAITGPSGAGKSTLINILALLDSPEAGEYQVGGQRTSTLRKRDVERIRARLFGFVFQQSNAIDSLAVDKNVEIPLASSRVPLADRAQRVATAARLAHIEHKVTAKVSLLSGGERQRMAIARAIVNNGSVLFLDEPTGNLDSANTQSVLELITSLNRAGTTIILVTHDLELAKFATRQVRVFDGRLTELVAVSQSESAPAPADALEFLQTLRVKSRPRPRAFAGWLRARSDAVSEALFTLYAHPLRTVAVLLSVALGVAGLVAGSSLGLTAQAQIDQLISASSSDSVTVSLAGSSQAPAKQGFGADPVARISALDGVSAVGYQDQVAPSDASISRFGSIPTDVQPIPLVGVSSGTFSALHVPVRSSVSHLLDIKVVNLNTALVGAEAARSLGIVNGKQQSIWIGGSEFDVLGILPTASQNSSMAASVVISHDALMGLGLPTRSQLAVRTVPGHSFVVAQAIPYALDPANPGHFVTDGAANLLTLRRGVSTSLDGLLLALACVFLGISILTTSATMTNSVLQRRGEIGLRMATGASRFDIAGLFVVEGGIGGLIGGIVGSAIGVVAVIVISLIQHWDPYFDVASLLIGIVSGALAGIVASIAPSVRASRIQPSQALRS